MAQLALKGGTPVRTSPYPSWPVWDEKELDAVSAVVNSGRWGMAQGDRVKELEKRFAAYQEAAYGIAASSGTSALRVALLAAGLEAGAEVIVPAYTFVATATAVIEANMVPVFADIDPDTYKPADMDSIGKITRERDLVVIEDACQAWGSEYRGRKVGAIDLGGAFSFQSSKHITAGEGGMLVTDEEDYAERCRSIVNCGRKAGGAWHEHVRLGGNYRLSELQAAVIHAQLERYEKMLTRRQQAAAFLREKLARIDGIRPLAVPEYATATSFHLFILRYDSESFGGLSKENFIKALNAEGICPAHGGYYIPLYRQPVLLEKNVGPYDLITRHEFQGKVIDYSSFDCPVAERACRSEAVWILQNLLLADRENLEDIVRAVEKVRENYGELLR